MHHDVTQKIAEDVGFYGPYAEIMAEADNNVDNDSDTTPFIPDVGNFSCLGEYYRDMGYHIC